MIIVKHNYAFIYPYIGYAVFLITYEKYAESKLGLQG